MRELDDRFECELLLLLDVGDFKSRALEARFVWDDRLELGVLGDFSNKDLELLDR